ncbi:uncharacterized protein LOC131067930 [Cryptomeria japonica]|uniref:uncharacterized protein LOC131067930 n=1 Tax=Cryptomeria japonica TaxID=3369 RepID=UPI0025ABA76B|nr:uncharacterized protein LOC131067930 [Cryptomeria japonica]
MAINSGDISKRQEMKLRSWNLRGLNSPEKNYSLKQCIATNKVDIILIQEVKMTYQNFATLVDSIWLGSDFSYSKVEGASGGITTLWNKSKLDGHDVGLSHSFLTTRFTMNNFSSYFFNICTPNTRYGQALVWEEITTFMTNNRETMFMLAGDFNTPLFPFEKLGGLTDYSDSMLDFANFIRNNEIFDLDLQGNPFTWSNNRKGSNLIQVRLDRFLISAKWDLGNNSSLLCLPHTISDHSPILLSWVDKPILGPIPFRYEIMWHSHPDFKQCIQNWWNSLVQGSAMFRIAKKLEIIKRKARAWSKSSFGDIFKRNKEVETNLDRLQRTIAEGITSMDIHKEEECWRQKWKGIMSLEEIY